MHCFNLIDLNGLFKMSKLLYYAHVRVNKAFEYSVYSKLYKQFWIISKNNLWLKK